MIKVFEEHLINRKTEDTVVLVRLVFSFNSHIQIDTVQYILTVIDDVCLSWNEMEYWRYSIMVLCFLCLKHGIWSESISSQKSASVIYN